MNASKKRIHKALTSIALIIAFGSGLVIARYFLFREIRDRVQEKLAALNDGDLSVRYDSVYIDWWRNELVLENIVFENNPYDTTCLYPEFISATQLKAEGFSLIRFITNNALDFDRITLQTPRAVIRKNSGLIADSSAVRENEFSLHVDKVNLIDARFEYLDSVGCAPIAEFASTVSLDALSIDFHLTRAAETVVGSLTLDNSTLVLPEAFYTLSLHRGHLDRRKGTLDLDTIRIIPRYGKIEFGKKAGKQIDRIEGIIPFFRFSDCTFLYQDTIGLRAKHVEIQAFMKLFRDKRLVHEPTFKPLPVEYLRSLPFVLKIDTMVIRKSYVEYEEFPTEGETTGKVFFDDLVAKITNIDNDKSLINGVTTIDADALLMGKGKVTMHTEFPWKKQRECLMVGSLRDFPFTAMNPVLEPMANMKAESGQLDELGFSFTYDGHSSAGKVELFYRDLKLVTFRENENGENKRNNADPKKDNFKTFILNTFVIKKNMTEKMPKEKRQGAIGFERDTTRSIFNYWWKSIFTGIKAAYNMDQRDAEK